MPKILAEVPVLTWRNVAYDMCNCQHCPLKSTYWLSLLCINRSSPFGLIIMKINRLSHVGETMNVFPKQLRRFHSALKKKKMSTYFSPWFLSRKSICWRNAEIPLFWPSFVPAVLLASGAIDLFQQQPVFLWRFQGTWYI